MSTTSSIAAEFLEHKAGFYEHLIELGYSASAAKKQRQLLVELAAGPGTIRSCSRICPAPTRKSSFVVDVLGEAQSAHAAIPRSVTRLPGPHRGCR